MDKFQFYQLTGGKTLIIDFFCIKSLNFQTLDNSIYSFIRNCLQAN